jgi:hypothetical protein
VQGVAGAAPRAAGAIGPSLERIGAAEARAERTWRTGVEAQRAADATGIAHLSETAMAAIGVVSVAKDDHERVAARRAAQAKEQVTGELAAFGRAVAQRFGDAGVCAPYCEQQGAAAPWRRPRCRRTSSARSTWWPALP